ncbi:MAG: hypothetical protein CFE28_14750 [Alphaproteobacteria bacterium PA2]|nr:MAG: hypothetical protein CFE28_14750 [Alphaproteobacteria bacterium PA2]
MVREFLVWLQDHLGKGPSDTAQSWSQSLLGSLNFWGLIEGTHLLSLMLFAGTILFVDLRLLGATFQRTPVSVLSRRVLPMTVFGFALMIVTGMALFFAKPLFYYHNIWFRAKLVFLALAMINIVVFHVRARRNQEKWDALPKPPADTRLLAALSLTSWVLVITLGRFMAYSWFDCGKPIPHWVNVVQDCQASENGAVDLSAMTKAGGQGS